MSYQRKEYWFPNACEVEESHSYRYGAPGKGRAKKEKATPEDVERVNQWKRVKTCRHKLRMYFKVNDYFVTLTYKKELRPESMEEAVKQFRSFIQKVQRRYKKAEKVLRWIRNIEVGSRNGWHIHMVINRIPGTDLILQELWQYGYVDIKLLRSFREFAEVAPYLTKTPKTDKRLRQANYSSSRNMPLPEPVKKVYRHWKTWRTPRIKKGWYLDEDSLVEGINPVTGYPYRHYTILRIERIEKEGERWK